MTIESLKELIATHENFGLGGMSELRVLSHLLRDPQHPDVPDLGRTMLSIATTMYIGKGELARDKSQVIMKIWRAWDEVFR